MALKDITLGQYFPGNSLVHRLDPRTKLLGTVAYIVALFLAKGIVGYAVLLAVLVGTIAVAGWSEGAGALAAIAGVGVYYFALWLFRRKIEHTIQFTITKI